MISFKGKYLSKSNDLKIFINEEFIGQKNLLTITGKVSVNISNNSNFYVKELIFLTFSNAYNNINSHTMQLKSFDIYNLIHELSVLYKTKKSDYIKFTDSSKSNNTEGDEKKFLSLRFEPNNKKYFINLNINMNKVFKPVAEINFEEYEVNGVIKILEAFISEYKTSYYKLQRAYEKINNKRKKEEENKW